MNMVYPFEINWRIMGRITNHDLPAPGLPVTKSPRKGLGKDIVDLRTLFFNRYCAVKLIEYSLTCGTSSCGNVSFSSLKISCFKLSKSKRLNRAPVNTNNPNPVLQVRI